MFFRLIYNPDSNSRFHESIGTLTACLSAYSHSYKSYSTSHNCGANSDVLIFGDFNLPRINWQTNTGTTTFERAFLDMVSDFGLSQFIHPATHMKGNCLDLDFGTVDSIPFSIPITRLPDPFPVIFEIEILWSIKFVSNIDSISKSFFLKQIFDAN